MTEWWPPPQVPPAKRGLSNGAVVMLVVAGLVACLVLGVAWLFLLARVADRLNEVPASEAGCREDRRETAFEEERNHATVGTKIEYRFTPPAFGRHWPNFLRGSEIKSFYSVADRPPVERLVHSLEHGYTILWYDVREEERARDIAGDVGPKFIAAPWTEADGPPLPEGAHAVLVHWSVQGPPHANAKEAAVGESSDVGVWRVCDHVSQEVADDFIELYPYTDSHEPNAP